MFDGHSTLYWMHPGWLWTLAALALALVVFRRTSERPLRTVAGPALLVALLLGALAEPGYRYATAERFTVLAVDESASIRGAAGERASQFVARLIELAGDDQLAVLPFAGRPGKLHEGAGLAETQDRTASGTDLEPLASNPARALLAAAAQVPADKAGQIVLLTDGQQTDGDLLKAAVGAGLPVSVVPLEALAGPEVCLVELRVPASAEPRDDFEADAVIESNHDDSGTLSLRRDGQLVAERGVELKAGRNVVPLRPVMPAADRALWVAELTGFNDTSAENNRRSAIVFAGARPRVLILADDAPAAGRMAAALDSQGFEASTLAPADWAQAPPALEHLGVLILLDLGIKELPEDMQRTLERFARDGGGVLAIGGSSTFAAADYRQTVLEGILPVGALAEAEPRQASLALVLVIDKSGSMGDDQRLELAKLAARRVVNLLAEQDQLGVLAFATDSSWVTPIAPDTNKPELEKRIDALRRRRHEHVPGDAEGGSGPERSGGRPQAADPAHRRHLGAGEFFSPGPATGQSKSRDFDGGHRRRGRFGIARGDCRADRRACVSLCQSGRHSARGRGRGGSRHGGHGQPCRSARVAPIAAVERGRCAAIERRGGHVGEAGGRSAADHGHRRSAALLVAFWLGRHLGLHGPLCRARAAGG